MCITKYTCLKNIYIYICINDCAHGIFITSFKTECFEHVEQVPKQKVDILAIFFQHESELFKYFPFSILLSALIKRILRPYFCSKLKLEALCDLFCKLTDFGKLMKRGYGWWLYWCFGQFPFSQLVATITWWKKCLKKTRLVAQNK